MHPSRSFLSVTPAYGKEKRWKFIKNAGERLEDQTFDEGNQTLASDRRRGRKGDWKRERRSQTGESQREREKLQRDRTTKEERAFLWVSTSFFVLFNISCAFLLCLCCLWFIAYLSSSSVAFWLLQHARNLFVFGHGEGCMVKWFVCNRGSRRSSSSSSSCCCCRVVVVVVVIVEVVV